MNKEIIIGIMLTLVTTSLLNTVFNVTNLVTDSSVNELRNSTKQKASQSSKTPRQTRPYQTSKNQFDLNTFGEVSATSSSVSVDNSNSDKTNEWTSLAHVDGDSAELVIGVNNSKPNNYNEIVHLIAEDGGFLVKTISMGEVQAIVANISLSVTSSFVTKMRTFGLSRYVEPNMKFHITSVPNDPNWPLQWGPRKIEADYAWNTTIGDPSVLVAVIDTGIDWNHPDLAANYVPLGYDWVNNDADPMDDHGHGTHCAGIVAAVINNGIGVAGLAQVRIMAEKGIDSGGLGTEANLAQAIIHAVNQGARILSNSWGDYQDSALIHDAVKYAYEHDVLVVAAAGNDATNTKLYPAGYEEVIAVTATDQNDNPAWFTNFGDWVELAAPGVDIYSTIWNDGYAYMSGTSMATPHVAGVAALVWSQFPLRSPDWVRYRLQTTADDLGVPGFDVFYGCGRLNARRAVEESVPEHELLILRWKTPPYVEPRDTKNISTTVINFGLSDENAITVQLFVNGSVVDSAFISSLPIGSSTTVNCSWNPLNEGMYNVTSYVVPVSGEAVTENNVIWRYICVGFPLKAVVLNSAGNEMGEIITNWQVLNTNWNVYGDRMIFIDYTTLDKDNITYDEIAATDADVLIISCAAASQWQFTDSEIDAITRYVYEGHGIIATAGTLYYGVPNNNKLAPLFGLNESVTWDATYTDLLHIQYPTHPLFSNIPNPFTFPQLGTAIPSDWRWDDNELMGGTYAALGHYLESAIVVFRGLVYISPWLEIIPPYYNFHLQLLYNAITWSSYQKPEHELVVSLESPSHLKPSTSVVLNVTVSNSGLNDEKNVMLQLLLNSSIVDSAMIPELRISESYTLAFSWAPTIEDLYNVTAFAPPVLGEEFTGNNQVTRFVVVSSAPVIGIIETHVESLHSEDLPKFYRSLGYVVEKIRATLTPEVINSYDILIVGEDWNNIPWSPVEIAAMKSFVDSGHGFLAVGDELATSVQEILSVYGIGYAGGWPMSGPSNNFNRSHPIMQDVIYIYAGSPINSLRVVVPAYYIANDASNMFILIGGAEVGGKVLCMSDDFAAYFYDFDNSIVFKNIAEWMQRYEHELKVSLDAPAFLEPRDSTLLNASVHNNGFNTEIDVELLLLINGTTVAAATVPELLSGSSYKLSYPWTTPAAEATYNITTYAPPVPGEEIIEDNVATKMIHVRFVKGHVVFEEAHEPVYTIDDNPAAGIAGGYAQFAEYLAVNGYTISTINPGTIIDLNVLASADVLVIVVPMTSYFPSEIDAIETWVKNGGNLLLISDWDDFFLQASAIAARFGIELAGNMIHDNDEYVGGFTYWPFYDGANIVSHPITAGVNRVEMYAGDGILSAPLEEIPLIVTDSDGTATWDNGSPALGVSVISALEGGTTGLGKLIIVTDCNIWDSAYDIDGDGEVGLYDSDNEILALNSINWLTTKYDHELAASLEAPSTIDLGDSTALTATVSNLGLSNEKNVELQLLIDSIVVNSTIIPELPTGEFNIVSYLWTPTIVKTYNVSAYVPAVPEEHTAKNNLVCMLVKVRLAPRLLVVDTPVAEDTGALDMLGYKYKLVKPTEFATVDLYQYDVLFIGWEPGDTLVNALLARASEIANWVDDGNGIVALAEFEEVNRWTWLPLKAEGSTGFHADTVHILNTAHPVMLDLSDFELSNWGNSYHGYFIGGSFDPTWEALADGVEAVQPITLAATFGSGRIVITYQDPDYHLYYQCTEGARKLLINMIDWVAPLLHEQTMLAAPSIVDPTLRIGSTFSINITVASVQDMWAYQFALSYNTNVLTAISFSSYEPFVFPWPSGINDTEGWVYICFSMPLGTTIGFSTVEPTPIARIDFIIDAYGASPLDLHDSMLVTPTATPIGHDEIDGVVVTPKPDVAVTNLVLQKTIVGRDLPILNPCYIYVSVENHGEVEVTLNLTAYADTTIIGRQIVILAQGESRTLEFPWRPNATIPYGYCIISAQAEPVPGETDLDDNTKTDGTILVTIPGDVDGDRTVGIVDAGQINGHWTGPPPGLSPFDPNCDINNDGIISIADAGIVNAHFWESW